MRKLYGSIMVAILLLSIQLPASAGWMEKGHEGHKGHEEHMKMMKEKAEASQGYVDIEVKDITLMNQDGKKERFKSDVIGDNLVAMTFIYTSCTTICPVYSAIFADLQGLLGDRLGRGVKLVTVTLDPTTDIPPRMKKEARTYGAKPGWEFITGEKRKVDDVLKGLDAYFADFTQHPPMAIVGDGKTGKWKRFNGFPKPAELLAMIDEFEAERSAATTTGTVVAKGGHGGHHEGEHGAHHEEMHGGGHDKHHEAEHHGQHEDCKDCDYYREHHKEGHHEMEEKEHEGGHHEGERHEKEHEGTHHEGSRSHMKQAPMATPVKKTIAKDDRARAYFTDLPLVNQEGKQVRFYSDVLKGRIVAISFFYADCPDACPLIFEKLKEVQGLLNGRVGRDITFVAISVDPENDTPEVLGEYKKDLEVGDGWIFLTGEKGNVNRVIYRLGQYQPSVETHSTMLVLGNVKDGRWAKMNASVPAVGIAEKIKFLANTNSH